MIIIKKRGIRLCRKSNGQTLVALSLSIRNLSESPRNAILKVPSESLSLNVVSESGPSTNWVVVVDRKMMGPFEALVFIFEGIEYDIELFSGRGSSELTPRPMRTMISENWAEEEKDTTSEYEKPELKVFQGYVRQFPEKNGIKNTCVYGEATMRDP
jgi:hypothetical protein